MYETKKKRGKIVNLSRCSMKKIRELIVFTAFLVVALWKFDVVIEVLKSIWKIVFPFALGGAIAFVINVPMSFLEKKMLGKIKEIASDMELRLQIGLSRHCPISYLEDCLSHFWGNKNFYSIDLYGDELAQPIENFKGIYRRAKKEGLRLKAHVGEWGTAKDVRTAVEELELDEVQHGIAAADDESVIRFLADHKIRLNITPTSNILLGRVADMSMHPIGKLYRSGVDVTINSDDVLIFDSDVSKEYLRLYESQCLTAEELDNIRKNGLKPEFN